MSNIFEDAQPQQSKQKSGHKTWEDYQRLRRENPKRYYSSKTQREMVQDRLQLGREAFYGEND
jgi:hypothetical protein